MHFAAVIRQNALLDDCAFNCGANYAWIDAGSIDYRIAVVYRRSVIDARNPVRKRNVFRITVGYYRTVGEVYTVRSA